MAKEKAHAFLEHLIKNPELQEKLKGFTLEELKEAVAEKKANGELPEDNEGGSYTL